MTSMIRREFLVGNPQNKVFRGVLQLHKQEEEEGGHPPGLMAVCIVDIPASIRFAELWNELEHCEDIPRCSLNAKIVSFEQSDGPEKYGVLLCFSERSSELIPAVVDQMRDRFQSRSHPRLCDWSVHWVAGVTGLRSEEDGFLGALSSTFGDSESHNCVFCFDTVMPLEQHTHDDKPEQPVPLQSQVLEPNPFVRAHSQSEQSSGVSQSISVLCGHVFHIHRPCFLGCTSNRCPLCSFCMVPEQLVRCLECGLAASAESRSLWMCLVCGHVGCGRFTPDQCALRHFQCSSHSLAKHTGSPRVWDFTADDFVARVLRSEQNRKLMAQSRQSRVQQGWLSSKKHPKWTLLSDKHESLVSEMEQLLHSQLTVQQQILQDKRAAMQLKYESQLARLDGRIAEFNKHLSEVEAKFPEEPEDLADIAAQLASEHSRRDKLDKLGHSVLLKQRNFGKELERFESELKLGTKLRLEAMDRQLAALSDTLRDYSTHVRTQRRLEQSGVHADDVTSVSLAEGKSKNNWKRGLSKKQRRRVKKKPD